VWLVVPLLDYLAGHRKAMPIRSIAGWVDGGLLIAGLVEAQVTPHPMQLLME
jgi:uncharacterized membrane protein SpoIIM required for sporulation